MLTLRRPYPQVQAGARIGYGGNQMWAENENIRQCGCGPVAALDLLHYLSPDDSRSPLPLYAYNAELQMICRRYLPLIPRSGINGLMLAVGVNRLFHHRGLPYYAVWACSGGRLWERVREMLEQDIPVILAVGPNFPLVWQKNRLRFYIKTADGAFCPASAAKSHYVTVTGMDDDWLRIASWGREYYISKREYEAYIRRHSSYLFSNILYIRRKNVQ